MKDIDKFTLPLPLTVRLSKLADHYLDRITPSEAEKFAEWCGSRVPFCKRKRYNVRRILLGLDVICRNPAYWSECDSLDEALNLTNEKED